MGGRRSCPPIVGHSGIGDMRWVGLLLGVVWLAAPAWCNTFTWYGLHSSVWDYTTAGPTAGSVRSNWTSSSLPMPGYPGADDLAQFALSVNNPLVDLNGSRQVGSVTFGGATGHTLTGGALTVGTGSLTAGGTASHTIQADVVLGSAGTWDIGSATALTVTGSIADAGAGHTLSKSGGGTLTLGGDNALAGMVLVAGKLRLAQSAAAPDDMLVAQGGVLSAADGVVVTADVTLAGNLDVEVSSGEAAAMVGDVSQSGGNRSLRKMGSGTLVLGGSNSLAGNLTLAAGRLVLASGGAGGSSTVRLEGGQLTYATSGAIANAMVLATSAELTAEITTATHTGVVSGSGDLVKRGIGTLQLSATNTYTGATRVLAGKLAIDQAYLSGTSQVEVAPGAALELNFDGADTVESLLLDGHLRGPGTHGAVGSGADFEWPQFSGSGMLLVTAFAGLAGDYNNDGVVNIADYTVWRDHLGQPSGSLLNDVDGGVIGAAQYQTWKLHFGDIAGAVAQSARVPEPATPRLLAVMATMLAAVVASRRLAS